MSVNRKILSKIIFLIFLISTLPSIISLSIPPVSHQQHNYKINTLESNGIDEQSKTKNKRNLNSDIPKSQVISDEINDQVNSISNMETPLTRHSIQAYSPLGTISINSNEDFATQAKVEGWPGDGSARNPFIIEGYNITDNKSDLILINNTSVYFIIRHNYFDGINNTIQGICLVNTRNSRIEENIFRQTDVAISLNRSRNNKLVGNNINSSHDLGGGLHTLGFYGIYLDNSSNYNEIIGNIISDIQYDGIKIAYNSNHNIIKANVIKFGGYNNGINLDYVSDNTIQKNLIHNTSTAINLDHANKSVISSNVCTNSSRHITLQGVSYHNIISENYFFDCGSYAIHILDNNCYYTMIRSNTFNNSRLFTDPDYPQYVYTHMKDNGMYSTIEYNYWGQTGPSGHYHNWLDPDSDSDGIVDIPYPINGTANNEDPYPKTQPDRLVSLEKIIIDEHDDFIKMNCSGSGTANKPFIIENYYIFCYLSNMIEVHNISTYFVIRNNYLDGLRGKNTGILFKNVTHGIIDENMISHTSTGIKLLQSFNNTLSNNTITSMLSEGIKLQNSDNNTCTQNYCTLSSNGVVIKNSQRNNITFNTLIGNKYVGIFVDANFNTIDENVIENSETGIELAPLSSFNKLHGNEVFFSRYFGFFLDTSNTNNISSNKIYHCKGEGILVLKSENTFIQFNDFKSIYLANIHVVDCYLPNFIQYNKINYPNIGVEIENSACAFVYKNSILNSKNIGILLTDNSTNNTIQGNGIEYSSTGIKITSTNGNFIRINFLTECINGIELDNVKDTILYKNTFNRCDTSISLKTGSQNNTISNNIIYDSARFSIHVEFSHNNSLINNIVIRSLFHGFTLTHSENNTISQNIFSKTCRYAIIVYSNSKNTTIMDNEFLKNNVGGLSQAFDDGNSSVLYNYWDDWTNPDQDLDEYVDNPYPLAGISGTMDPLPRANCYHITPPNITSPIPGDVINGTLTIEWDPATDGSTHYLTYTIEYSSDEGRSWKTLISELTIINYTFDSIAINNGHYLIKVIAECFIGFTAFDVLESPVRFYNHLLASPELIYPSEDVKSLWGYEVLSWKEITDPYGHSVSYSVFCSHDYGITWIPIGYNLFSEYIWNTALVPDNETYILMVEAHCSEGLSQVYISDSFMIHNGLSAPKVINPLNNITINRTIPIQWEPSNDSLNLPIKYDIHYSMDNGTTWNLIVSDIVTEAGDTMLEYEWNTMIYDDGLGYQLKVVAKTQDGVTAETIIVDLALLNDYYVTKYRAGASPGFLGFAIVFSLITIVIYLKLNRKFSSG